MGIKRRNRLINRYANHIAEAIGLESQRNHEADPDQRHYRHCCWQAYEDAARNAFDHLTRRRVYRHAAGHAVLPFGLPYLQQEMAV